MWWLPLALLWATPAHRQLERTAWTTADGLPQSSVTSIAQTPDGTLVVGTYGGLVDFDGRTFEPTGPAYGALWSGLRVTAVAVDPSGAMFVGTQDGRLLRRANGSTDDLPIPKALEGHAVWSVALSDEQIVAVGGGGAAHFDGQSWDVLDVPGEVYVGSIDAESVWIGGSEGLFRSRGGHLERQDAPAGSVEALCRGEAGLIVGGSGGVVRFGDEGVVRLDAAPADALLCGHDGAIWAANGSEVRALDGAARVDVEHPVVALFEDREKNIWVGTEDAGLVRLTPEEWSVAALEGGVLSMVEEAPGQLLVAGYCGKGGLFRHEVGGGFEPLLDDCVRAIAVDDGDIILGVEHEVHRWVADALEPIVDVGRSVLTVLPRADGLWIGTDGAGVKRWTGGVLEAVDVGDDRVLAIAEDSQGALWFGTHTGLARLHAGELQRWTQADGVPPGPIRDLLVGDDVVFMASYGGGLGAKVGPTFHRLTAADGLAGNTLSSIIDDGRGALWINGNRGLNRIERASLQSWLTGSLEAPRIRRWHTPEGNGGGHPAGVLLRSGTLALPTIEGVLTISPKDVIRNDVQPTVVLRAGDVDGLPLEPGQRLVVPAGPGRVHVEFTAATLRHPELATLEYRVVLDDDDPGPWRVAQDGQLTLGGVRPGSHAIDLRASNEDGVPSDVMRLAFDMQPQFYERVSFWLGIAALVAAAGAGAHAWRIRAVAEKNRELQREVRQRIAAEEERERIAQRLSVAERMEAVGRLAGGVAHDFNNLLTAVAGASAVLRDETQDPTRTQPLDSLDRCVERGASLTRRLLAFARQQPIAPSRIDASAQLAALLPLLKTTVRDDIEIDIEIEPRAKGAGLEVDTALFELAVVNLVLNAVDAMPSGGRITLRVDRVERAWLQRRFPSTALRGTAGWVVVSVEDDGIGMSSSTLAKAREPFFTTRAHGNGLGLSSVDGFVEQSGGEMHIVSELAEGTTVSLVLPEVTGPPAPQAAREPEADRVGTGRVLLCDDDDLVRQSLVRVLERAGYETSDFADPVELLERAEPEDFDILVTDVLMPGLSGDALAQRMRERAPDLPVIFISGYTDDVRPEALEGRLLLKPFRSHDVVTAVAEVLEESGGGPPGSRRDTIRS